MFQQIIKIKIFKFEGIFERKEELVKINFAVM